ncbi:MAG: alpha-galactosidase [Paludibacteraceae bacterium]|nr:alpha-galactosidase [Paludibacteraceae bacterium]
MKRFYSYLFLAAAVLSACNTPPASDRLVCDEVEIQKFPYGEKGFYVEKLQTVTPVEQYPGLEVIETKYVNHGKPLTVRAYEMCRTEIRAKDTVVWSLQPSSSNARMDWVLPVQQGFRKENYLGMNNSDYGGGIPVLDLWQRDGGIAIGLFEPVLRMISMPVEWKRYTDKVCMALRYDLPEPVEFLKGDTITCFKAFRYTHSGDYFNALRTFSQYMQQNEGIKMQPSEPDAFEPVWCAWGYERLFTINEVIGTLDKVAELGFKWVDVDDGYQIAEGDWQTNSRFTGGDRDMRRMTDEIHRRGMKAKLWWAPLAADPGTRLLKEHPEMMLLTEEWAPEFITWWNSWYLSPVNPATDAYTRDLLKMFIQTWGFDGLKIDGQHLNCCLPDYNDASQLDYPAQAPEQMPSYFGKVLAETRRYKPDAVVQVCPCGCAVNYFLLPNINQAVASDPTSSMQVRMKRKAYAAMAPALAYYGDHVELTDGGCDFASQIGVGAVIGSKFTYPKDNPYVTDGPFLLTPEREQLIRKWMRIFKENDLARGEYLNLYIWGFDLPEAHVISQNNAMYYAFYADQYKGQIELRGLEKNTMYAAIEYTADEPRQFTIDGNNPYIEADFTGNWLLKLTKL